MPTTKGLEKAKKSPKPKLNKDGNPVGRSLTVDELDAHLNKERVKATKLKSSNRKK
jgi:hypothetical protein